MLPLSRMLSKRVLNTVSPLYAGQPVWDERGLRGVMPLFYGHIKPYGIFPLDMGARLGVEEVTGWSLHLATRILVYG